jgi:hypothetical protein
MWGGSRGAGLGGPSGLALREMFAAVHKLQIQKKSSDSAPESAAHSVKILFAHARAPTRPRAKLAGWRMWV